MNEAGMTDKLIGYTARYNAFIDETNRPSGFTAFSTDGEGIHIDNYLKTQGTSMKEVVSFANIMMYDVPPSDLGVPGGLTLQ